MLDTTKGYPSVGLTAEQMAEAIRQGDEPLAVYRQFCRELLEYYDRRETPRTAAAQADFCEGGTVYALGGLIKNFYIPVRERDQIMLDEAERINPRLANALRARIADDEIIARQWAADGKSPQEILREAIQIIRRRLWDD